MLRKSTLLTPLLLTVLWMVPAAGTPACAGQRPTNFAIMSPDGSQILGHGHYDIDISGSTETVTGENVYLDGQHDEELERLVPGVGNAAPTLISYRHTFFRAAGSTLLESSIDAATGEAKCNRYLDASPELNGATLTVPSDTYAGASVLIPVEDALRDGRTGTLSFHTFNCLPGPKIFAVQTSLPGDPSPLLTYEGDPNQLQVGLDLGFLNLIVAPFLPRLSAWFDSGDSWNYVGGMFDRYYRGPRILMVRVAPSPSASPTPGAK